MLKLKQRKWFVPFLLVLAFMMAACDGDDGTTSQQEEGDRRQSAYDRMVANQPASTMTHSPTRETMNFWVDKWNEPGKLSFVYLMAGNGQIIGYYVLEGLPVSYCAMLSPTYQQIDTPNDSDDDLDTVVPAPGNDGAYYSGGQCNQYYGKDATTGAFMEWSIGGSLNYLLFDEPIEADVEPLGFTTIEDVENQ